MPLQIKKKRKTAFFFTKKNILLTFATKETLFKMTKKMG